jgi:8-oxo-dGTP pyrophosphatase MutT (NUDIX family)
MGRLDIQDHHKVFIYQKCAVMNSNNEVLLLRRSDTARSRPLGWDLPGGSLHFGEDLEEGIKREISEEADLEVENLRFIHAQSFLRDDRYSLMIGYMGVVVDNEVTLSFEHDMYKWVKIEEAMLLDLPESYKNIIMATSKLLKV